MKPDLSQFQNQSYLNLESFRKNGEGVKTPLWFVEEGGRLYVRTGADSWKVKRMRRNPQVKITPSKAQGEPLGEWVVAHARFVDEPRREKAINDLFDRKYGVQKRMFELMGKVRKLELATLELELGI